MPTVLDRAYERTLEPPASPLDDAPSIGASCPTGSDCVGYAGTCPSCQLPMCDLHPAEEGICLATEPVRGCKGMEHRSCHDQTCVDPHECFADC